MLKAIIVKAQTLSPKYPVVRVREIVPLKIAKATKFWKEIDAPTRYLLRRKNPRFNNKTRIINPNQLRDFVSGSIALIIL